MTVAITRVDLTSADLRKEAARARDGKAARRMLAIALVLEEHSRETAAESCGMDRQTLRDWAHRDNEVGLARRPGRPRPSPRLSPEQQVKVAEWVEHGPDLERDGATLAPRRSATVDLTGVCGAVARAHGWQAAAQIVVPAAIGATAASTGFADLVTAVLSGETAGKPVEVWFTDG